ncbi:uncharacterized protein [Onthophagus taurus]|uniref:uncharacterized protein n=1 Tax=Onthophagus taurus TaxID=166361 RepID=UPI000C20FB1D|nr:uncharacterized protein LOC111424827 [Onthophagus taurus]
MNFFALTLVLAFCVITPTKALKCYTCTSTDEAVDEACINDPESVTASSAITECNKKYCYSIRVEFVDPKGKVSSMSRTCVDEPLYKSMVIEDSTFRTYYRACNEDLCNGGSGTDLSQTTSSIDNGKAITIFVRGTGSGSTIFASLGLILALQMYLRLN